MASLIPYTKKLLIQRIRQHIANDWPDADFSTSENEVLLYIDQALAPTLIGQVYAGAKVEGNICVPDGYMTTYLLPALAQDGITREWYTTLPQPPISLPLGYSLDLAYFANNINGRGIQVHLIRPNRVMIRRNLPRQFGVDGWVEGSKFVLQASDGGSLFNQNLYVRMAKTRTENIDEVLQMPDDSIDNIFTNVINKLIQRMQLPKDIISDDLSVGASNVTQK